MAHLKHVDTSTEDDGTVMHRIQVDIREGSASMQRYSVGHGQLLVSYVPVDDATFDANLDDVALSGVEGAQEVHMRTAQQDKTLEHLAKNSE